MVPSSRLREETTRRTEAITARDAATTALAELSTRYSALEASHKKATETHSRDLSLFGAGVTDPDVREFVRSRYTPSEDDGGFDGWLTKQRESPSPLLAPFLKAAPATATAPTTEQAPKPPAPKTDGGTSQPAAHNQTSWTLEEIKTSTARGDFASKQNDILAAMRAEGLIK